MFEVVLPNGKDLESVEHRTIRESLSENGHIERPHKDSPVVTSSSRSKTDDANEGIQFPQSRVSVPNHLSKMRCLCDGDLDLGLVHGRYADHSY